MPSNDPCVCKSQQPSKTKDVRAARRRADHALRRLDAPRIYTVRCLRPAMREVQLTAQPLWERKRRRRALEAPSLDQWMAFARRLPHANDRSGSCEWQYSLDPLSQHLLRMDADSGSSDFPFEIYSHRQLRLPVDCHVVPFDRGMLSADVWATVGWAPGVAGVVTVACKMRRRGVADSDDEVNETERELAGEDAMSEADADAESDDDDERKHEEVVLEYAAGCHDKVARVLKRDTNLALDCIREVQSFIGKDMDYTGMPWKDDDDSSWSGMNKPSPELKDDSSFTTHDLFGREESDDS